MTPSRTPHERNTGRSGKPVVIFGNTPFASMVASYLTYDSPWDVAAFTVHQAYIRDAEREGVPVVPFESIAASHPPADYQLLIALGVRVMNQLRTTVYRDAKPLGYECVSHVSSSASWARRLGCRRVGRGRIAGFPSTWSPSSLLCGEEIPA